jgi:hypothetical protein
VAPGVVEMIPRHVHPCRDRSVTNFLVGRDLELIAIDQLERRGLLEQIAGRSRVADRCTSRSASWYVA